MIQIRISDSEEFNSAVVIYAIGCAVVAKKFGEDAIKYHYDDLNSQTNQKTLANEIVNKMITRGWFSDNKCLEDSKHWIWEIVEEISETFEYEN